MQHSGIHIMKGFDNILIDQIISLSVVSVGAIIYYQTHTYTYSIEKKQREEST